MEQVYPDSGTPEILQAPRHDGHLSPAKRMGVLRGAGLGIVFVALAHAPAHGQRAPDSTRNVAHAAGSGHWWRSFAGGFASSILAHEGAHIVAAYVVGGRPSFGLNEGRPTIYSGIDATLEPGKQFVFSSAGLSVQSLVDEAILDSPHDAAPAGAFERGVLAGGIATSLFYITIGRTGSVSDVDYMARTSTLSKTTISAIFGGVALVHLWRIGHDDRYAHFFARPDPLGGMRVGVALDP